MYILFVSLTISAILGKVVSLPQLKQLLAQMSSPESEARRKIFDALGTVSTLQLLSN
jgi:hypothetical protein